MKISSNKFCDQETMLGWIQTAEIFYGMTDTRTAAVRRYFMALLNGIKAEVPAELKSLGYKEQA